MPVLCDPFLSELSSVGATLGQSGTNTSQRTTEESTTPTAENDAPNASSTVVMGFEEMHIDAVPFRRENTVPNQSPHIVSEVEVISMVDEATHPLVRSGDLEIPFTYLSNLSVKFAAMTKKSPSVLGKIKVCSCVDNINRLFYSFQWI